MDLSLLPTGDAPAALEFPHFPARYQALIWRNWNLVAPETIARVLHTGVREVCDAAAALGLEDHPEEIPLWQSRGYLTIIRRNWELLDYEQLLELLGWTPEKLAFILKEEDFLFHKLGLCKPLSPKLYYRPLTPAEKIRTEQIRNTVRKETALLPPREAPFHFLTQYGKRGRRPVKDPSFDLKMIYSFSALYGDPLEDDEIASYPEGMLADYAACGVNAVWMQATLYTLVPWLGEDLAISRNWQKRQRNLAKLIARSAKYGIKVILYLNEPRSMPESFFTAHPTWKGTPDADGKSFALCTSVPEVREALAVGVERLFRDVPGIGGIFTITMSENLTHCKSRNGSCPRCENRPAALLVAELNNLICRAMHRAAPEAKMLAYTWAWAPEWRAEVMRQLDQGIVVMTVSETDLPTVCLGHEGRILDYSISRPGPGESALESWRQADLYHLPKAAKVQFNSSWELSSVPYIPVPDLVEEHICNLKKAGVRNLMLSWTLGGYPGGNLELLRATKEELAEEKFGKEAAATVLKAWYCFSRAFHSYFPFNRMATIYFAPQNFGPMTLLYAKPTGRHASMIGFPFDDLNTWRGAGGNVAATPLEHPYPPEMYEEAFRLLSEKWAEGVTLLKTMRLSGPAAEELEELLRVAEAAYCHFRTTCCQIHWVRHRNDAETLREERKLAQRLLALMRRDSRLGFEASNHYFYTENDLLEKILNCDDLLRKQTADAL